MSWLTSDLPPIRGAVRAEPEDFVVEEVLLYEPSGCGTHLWVSVEKTGLTTFEAVRRFAEALGRREGDVGHAGLKDKHAVTRQTFTIEFVTEEDVARIDVPGLRVLDVTRHQNKLKLGHLRGNRFRLRVRDVGPDDEATARAVLQVLERRGVPNRFGPQRFGRAQVTPRLGRLLLADEHEAFLRAFAGAEDPALSPSELAAECRDRMLGRALGVWADRGRPDLGVRALPKRFLSLCTAALQSQVFNDVLARRLTTMDEVGEGDVAFLHRNGACFVVEDAAAEGPRAVAFEISPSGPLPGPSCLEASGAQGRLEAEVLAAHELTPASFACRGPHGQKGGRRPLRVPLGGGKVTAEGVETRTDVLLAFELPKGSYATAVLGELLKSEDVG